MNFRLKPIVLGLLCAQAPVPLLAQDGRGIQAGPLRVIPTLGVTLGRDSNVTRATNNEISSFVTIISPGIRFERGDQGRGFYFSYEGEFTRYEDSSRDNADHHRLGAGFNAAPTSRFRASGNILYERGQDARGEAARQGPFIDFQNRDPDEYASTTAMLGLEYGAPGARAGLGGEVGMRDLQYRNNRDYTVFRDHGENYFSANFRYRLAPKTEATLRGLWTQVDFDRLRPFSGTGGALNFDSDETSYFVGLSFDATAKTAGRIEVGRMEKEFDDPRIADFRGTTWVVGLQFRPRTYSVIDLSTTRVTDESNDLVGGPFSAESGFVLRRDWTLAWTHGWTDRWQTTVDFGQANEAYRSRRDSGLTTRDDDIRFWGVATDYRFRPWLSFGAGYKSYTKDSNRPLFDYERRVFLLSVEGTL